MATTRSASFSSAVAIDIRGAPKRDEFEVDQSGLPRHVL
jgi:hypothetical protein